MFYVLLHPDMTPEHLGFLPSFLDESDPENAAKQFDKNYAYGGWRPQPGHKLRTDNALLYPGDPPLEPCAMTMLRDELIVFYDYAYVAIIQPDRTFEACRID